MKKKIKKENFFKTKKTTGFFAIIGLIGGFSTLNRNITGNVVLNGRNSSDLLSLIGILLILCSVVVGVYSLKKK